MVHGAGSVESGVVCGVVRVDGVDGVGAGGGVEVVSIVADVEWYTNGVVGLGDVSIGVI